MLKPERSLLSMDILAVLRLCDLSVRPGPLLLFAPSLLLRPTLFFLELSFKETSMDFASRRLDC